MSVKLFLKEVDFIISRLEDHIMDLPLRVDGEHIWICNLFGPDASENVKEIFVESGRLFITRIP